LEENLPELDKNLPELEHLIVRATEQLVTIMCNELATVIGRKEDLTLLHAVQAIINAKWLEQTVPIYNTYLTTLGIGGASEVRLLVAEAFGQCNQKLETILKNLNDKKLESELTVELNWTPITAIESPRKFIKDVVFYLSSKEFSMLNSCLISLEI